MLSFLPVIYSKSTFMFKYLHGLASLLFLLMAAVQLNDPDTLYWVAAYMATAAVAATNCIDRLGRLRRELSMGRLLVSVTMGMVLAGLLISISGVMDYLASGNLVSIYGQMSGENPYVESVREFGGLFIAMSYLVSTGGWK